jgi:hypothetical protein
MAPDPAHFVHDQPQLQRGESSILVDGQVHGQPRIDRPVRYQRCAWNALVGDVVNACTDRWPISVLGHENCKVHLRLAVSTSV